MTFVPYQLANGHDCAIPTDAPVLLVEASPGPVGPRTCMYLRNMIAFANGGVSAIVEGYIGDVALMLDPTFGMPSSPWAIVPTDDGGAVGLLKPLARCVEQVSPTLTLVWVAAVQPVSSFRMLRVALSFADTLDLLTVAAAPPALARSAGRVAPSPVQWPERRVAAPAESSALGRIAVAAPAPPAVLPAPVPIPTSPLASIGVPSSGFASLPLDAPRIAVAAPAPMAPPPAMATAAMGIPRAFPAPSFVPGVGTRVEASTAPAAVMGPTGLQLPDPVADLREPPATPAPTAAPAPATKATGSGKRSR